MLYGFIISVWLVYTSNFAFADFSTLDADDGELAVVAYTPSSITLKWKFPYTYSQDSYVYVLTRAVPQVRIGIPAKLEWNNKTGRYYAEYAHRPNDVYIMWVLDSAVYEILKNEVFIDAYHLIFPGASYFFESKRVEQTEEGQNKTIRARAWAHTQAIFPTEPPKSGAGLFHVYEVYSTNRKVKIFWQGIYGSGRYELLLYEVGSRNPVYTVTGPSEYAFSWCLISLKRTYAVLRSINEVGESQKHSLITIPAQDEILPAIPVQWNYTKSAGRYQISWQKPENITVSNYTVTWADRIDGKAVIRIADFVHLPNDETSFEVDSEQWVELALSVNTPTTSSGLRIARQVDCKDKTENFVIKCPGDDSDELYS